MLIRAECDINACDKNKWTPLMNACYWANEDAVLVLLKSGADSNLRNIVRKIYELMKIMK
jgi:ankyrin repeat protein